MVWTLLTKQQIERSPSVADNIPFSEELRLRRSLTIFLLKAGGLLELPIVTICTSCAFFQRFFSQCSFAKFNPYVIAQACLMLAAKAEENSRRVRDVVNTTEALRRQDKDCVHETQEYWGMKDAVIRSEQTLLRVFGFDLDLKHPHHYVLHFIRDLEGAEEIASVSWCILNDSLCTTLCLQYRPEPIACAAIYLAGEMIGEQVSHGEWWEKFDTSRVELEDIAHQLADMYELTFEDRRTEDPKSRSRQDRFVEPSDSPLRLHPTP